MIVDEPGLLRVPLGERSQALQVFVAEETMLRGEAGSVQDVLAGVGPGEMEHTLQETECPDAPLPERGLAPVAEFGADALTAQEQPLKEASLGGEHLFRALTWPRCKQSRGDADVDSDLDLAMEDADKMAIPANAHRLAEQVVRYGVEGAGDLDVTVGMDAASAALEDGERLDGQWFQGRLLDLEEVAPDLAPGRAVDAETSHGAIPVPEEGILLLQAPKAASLERIALDVAPGTLLLPVKAK